jgi:Rps23 Pro-64 3,4-dihydroxylase Tpa1-like proline 4-hydroxylase
MNGMITDIAWDRLSEQFLTATPFNHIVIDDFFLPELAEALSEEFPTYDDRVWYAHNNVVEVKKLVNHWDRFPPETYRVFLYLNSEAFLTNLRTLSGLEHLYADHGLHGGGWHIHNNVGKLNVHKDYSIHPKLGWLRKLNLIVYLSIGWNPKWGGALELWSQDPEHDRPFKKEKAIDVKFNRAVIFDTTQNSWHGLPEEIEAPQGHFRKSIAVYYLTDPTDGADQRRRALFAPTERQEGDKAVEEFIKKRAEWKPGELFFSDDKK